MELIDIKNSFSKHSFCPPLGELCCVWFPNWQTLWHNSWWSIFDVVERLCYFLNNLWNKYVEKMHSDETIGMLIQKSKKLHCICSFYQIHLMHLISSFAPCWSPLVFWNIQCHWIIFPFQNFQFENMKPISVLTCFL